MCDCRSVVSGQIVTAAGPGTSESLWPTIVPLIAHGIDENNSDAAFIVDETLVLWLSMVRPIVCVRRVHCSSHRGPSPVLPLTNLVKSFDP